MSEVPTITSDDLAAQSREQSSSEIFDGDWMLLDVRTDAEWRDGHVEGSVHIPLDQLMDRTTEVSERVVCICASGGRSAQATAYLNQTGRQAVNLAGGIHAWTAAGHALSR